MELKVFLSYIRDLVTRDRYKLCFDQFSSVNISYDAAAYKGTVRWGNLPNGSQWRLGKVRLFYHEVLHSGPRDHYIVYLWLRCLLLFFPDFL